MPTFKNSGTTVIATKDGAVYMVYNTNCTCKVV